MTVIQRKYGDVDYNPIRDNEAVQRRLKDGHDRSLSKRGYEHKDELSAQVFQTALFNFDSETAIAESPWSERHPDLDGRFSWVLDTWFRALDTGHESPVYERPDSFANVMGVVTSQALRAGDFDTAQAIFQGLATLRAGATHVMCDNKVFLATKRQGAPRPATQPGLYEAVLAGIVAITQELTDAMNEQLEVVRKQKAGLPDEATEWHGKLDREIGDLEKKLAAISSDIHPENVLFDSFNLDLAIRALDSARRISAQIEQADVGAAIEGMIRRTDFRSCSE